MAPSGNPWWFSGDAAAGAPEPSESQPRARYSAESSSDEPSSAESGMTLGSLLAGAQQLFDWASELVLAPHADHADPREHPECLVCKGTALVQGVRSAPPTERPAREITWTRVERQGF